jgi:hypothetical protein
MATELYQPFQDLLKRMQENSDRIARYLRNGGESRPWMCPPEREWDGNPLNIDSLKKPFDRPKPNEDLQTALSQEDKPLADAMGAELQISYMGMMERAFRHRHMTPTRAAMHAAGRRTGHGDPAGVHVGGVQQYVQDMISAGEGGSGGDGS